jgi:hypothetical protein
VVDSASPARDEQVGDVNKVLAEIGAAEVPQLMVLNKLDLTGLPPAVERDEYGKSCAFASALVAATVCRCCAKPWPRSLSPRHNLPQRVPARIAALQDMDMVLIQMVPHDF